MRTATIVLLTMLLAGCVPLEPFRYSVAADGRGCSPSSRDKCETASTERTSQYDLHYVEFDDQGLQYPADFVSERWKNGGGPLQLDPPACELRSNDCLHTRPWAYQINNLIKQLNIAASDPCSNGITLIVFIHGWKHNARADDANLRGFRAFLTAAAMIEKQRRRVEGLGLATDADLDAARSPDECTRSRLTTEMRRGAPRRIVGLYVSWRGNSIETSVINNITFWSRKTAAMHVAEGSSRELFARLRGLKCVQNNASQPINVRNCSRPPSPNDRVQIVLIGHSFGGLILYNSLSGSLIESMTHAFDTTSDATTPYWRFADLAVMINPAFEATRYAPLHRIAASTAYDHYEVPLLVTVTSTTDEATRVAFPAGRFFNTIFEKHASDEEKDANRSTIGHHDPYITHTLELLPAGQRPECPGWEAQTKDDDVVALEGKVARDLPIEFANSKDFFRTRRDPARAGFSLKPGWVRDFCGGVRLASRAGTDPDSPIWNVSAIGNPDLLPDHSDIMEPMFVAFFRQLYLDTFFLPGTVNAPDKAAR